MALLRGRLLRALAVSTHGVPWAPSLFSASNQFGGPLCALECGVEVKGSEPFQRTFFRTSVPCGTHVEFPLAQTGEGIAECEIIKWFVEEGQKVSRFEKICEVQSDKASIDITSPYEGFVLSVHRDAGDVVKVGEPLLTFDCKDGDQQLVKNPTDIGASRQQGPEKVSDETSSGGKMTKATPALRRFAKEKSVDLALVTGTGPSGRITKEDVIFFSQSQGKGLTGTITQEAGAPITRIPIKGYRRAMVKSMTKAAAIPHFHLCDDITMTKLMSTKAVLDDDMNSQGVKLTFLPIILKAISVALQGFPEINSMLSDDESEILQHKHHNLGVAMATPGGLVVPNVKRVEEKSIIDIAVEMGALRQKAYEGSLTAEDLMEGTLTVSNIGIICGTYATPLVNPPEVAIIALGKLKYIPVVSQVHENEPVSRLAIMPITWAADHRVVDGAMLAGFNNAWKRLVENPERLLLHLK